MLCCTYYTISTIFANWQVQLSKPCPKRRQKILHSILPGHLVWNLVKISTDTEVKVHLKFYTVVFIFKYFAFQDIYLVQFIGAVVVYYLKKYLRKIYY